MSDKVDLRLFTAAQIRDWLYHGTHYAGLSEHLIDKQRAFAILANPYVEDEMSLISALYVNDRLGAYTYVFPDLMEKPCERLIYWNTTLYVDPVYEGRGYAYIVIAQICELYGADYFDLDAAKASVENLKYQGLNVEYLHNYLFTNKNIHLNSPKGVISYVSNAINRLRKSRKNRLLMDISNSRYSLQYTSYVDDEMYEFIKTHSSKDVFLRKKETFNWILQYPFLLESPLRGRCREDCKFSSNIKEFKLYGVVVREDDKMVGFVILRSTPDEWAVKYLYYDSTDSKSVFLAIAEHLINYPKRRFFTTDEDLHDFVVGYNLYDHDSLYERSFAFPVSFDYDKGLNIQAGDGDNIT